MYSLGLVICLVGKVLFILALGPEFKPRMVVPISNCSAGEEGMGKYLGLATLVSSSPVRNTIKAVLLPLYACICTCAFPSICLRVHVHTHTHRHTRTHTVKILFKYSLSLLMWKMSDFWISMVCVCVYVGMHKYMFVYVFLCTCKHTDPQILGTQTHTVLSDSTWLLGIWTQVCMLVQQALYQLKHSPVWGSFC